MISGKTTLIAHVGYPTEAFKAPLIYNPYFEKAGIDAVVVPMGIQAADYPTVLKSLFRLTNIRGALVTMPHKVTTVALLDEVSTAVQVAGSCNAILRRSDGTLLGDMFDGAGFTRGLKRKNFKFAGASCLVVGTGGVGCAIAASIAGEGVAKLFLSDTNKASAEALAGRLKHHYPKMETGLRSNDPTGYDLVVNATPLGMKAGAQYVRGRSGNEAGDHTAPASSEGQGLPLSGRHRHAIRTDSRLPGVLRLWHDDPGRTSLRSESRLLGL
jgi:shikimate dehydrogenase